VTRNLYRRLRTAPTIGRLAPAYATLGVLKHVVSLQQLARWAWHDARNPRDADAERRVMVAVARLRQWFGHDHDCLQSSLLLYRELSRLGANPTLTVGFRRQNDRLEGHAWIFLDGRAIPGGSSEQTFTSALHFGRGGMLVSGRDER
jgi:Transglutaminase-like superfamily